MEQCCIPLGALRCLATSLSLLLSGRIFQDFQFCASLEILQLELFQQQQGDGRKGLGCSEFCNSRSCDFEIHSIILETHAIHEHNLKFFRG